VGLIFTAAGIWTVSLVFIILSIYFHFAEKLRVFLGLIVGSGVSVAVGSWIIDVTEAFSARLALQLSKGSEYEAAAIAAALPSIIAIVCMVLVWQHFRGGRGGRSGGGYGGGYGHGRRSGGRVPPNLALAAGIVLPVLVPGIGGAISGAIQ
jgi:hypothetical protein